MDVFHEIEYGTTRAQRASEKVHKTSKFNIDDPMRKAFLKMRDISRAYQFSHNVSNNYRRWTSYNDAEVFYKQALFLESYEDNYPSQAQFTCWSPNYQIMGYEQLRTYLTWRTQVRQGIAPIISMPYIQIHAFELIANIGVQNPQDGLDKLVLLYNEFANVDSRLDTLFRRWLKDYHIYYELPHSFKAFVEKNRLSEYYPKVIDDQFELFCTISTYNIKESNFFKEERELIIECFYHVLKRIRRDFMQAGLSFDESFFRPTRALYNWVPFSGALFFTPEKLQNRRVVLSDNEIYICEDNKWIFSTSITTQNGKQFMGYVMKKVESVLRGIKKYKYKLTAKANSVNAETQKVLDKKGISIEELVTSAVMEFYKNANKTIVEVDNTALARIRRESLVTQETLIVEQHETEQTEPINLPLIQNECKQPDGWEGLKVSLNQTELQALALILRNENIKPFADKCAIMPEVLAETINEKAIDCIGDSLIDDDFILYDDYKERIKELLG